MPLGEGGGEFRATVSYSTKNDLPEGWDEEGFPGCHAASHGDEEAKGIRAAYRLPFPATLTRARPFATRPPSRARARAPDSRLAVRGESASAAEQWHPLRVGAWKRRRIGGFGEAFRCRAGAEDVVLAPNDFHHGLLVG